MNHSEVTITVTGSGELSADEEIKTVSDGRHYSKNGKRYFLYELPDGNETGRIIKHRLTLHGGSLEITKSAPGYATRILYRPGASTETDYATPHGNIVLTFKTGALSVTENEEKLLIELDYEILAAGETLSKNLLKIECVPRLTSF